MRSSSSAAPSLAQRLGWISIFRTVAVALLLATYGVHVLSRPAPAELGTEELWLFALVGTSFFLSAVYGLWLRHGGNERLLAYAQLIGDGLLASGLCWLTGKLDSPFISVFLVAVLAGAVALGREGAFFTASTNSALIASIAIGTRLVDGRQGGAGHWVFPLTINLLAQFLIAALAGYLASQLAATGGRLVASQADLNALSTLHRQILACMPSGLLTVDVADRMTFANRSAAQILGLEENGQADLQRILPELRRLAPHPRRHELRVDIAGQPRVLGLSTVPFEGQPGVLLMVFQDLTALRRAEEELARADRLAALGKLSAELAHEIRNPLAAMRGAAQMLSEGGDSAQATGKLTGILIREADRLTSLVEDFLRFARPATPNRRPTAVDELVHQVLDVIRVDPLAQRVELQEQLVPLKAEVDPDQLRQVVINLVRNALAAAGPEGLVRVSLMDVEDALQLEIWDSAGSIDERDLPRLFEPFFTRRPGGTGLGLSTVHSIVTAHQGRISATSSSAKGTRFSVRIPRKRM